MPFESHVAYHIRFCIDCEVAGMAYLHLRDVRFRPPLPPPPQKQDGGAASPVSRRYKVWHKNNVPQHMVSGPAPGSQEDQDQEQGHQGRDRTPMETEEVPSAAHDKTSAEGAKNYSPDTEDIILSQRTYDCLHNVSQETLLKVSVTSTTNAPVAPGPAARTSSAAAGSFAAAFGPLVPDAQKHMPAPNRRAPIPGSQAQNHDAAARPRARRTTESGEDGIPWFARDSRSEIEVGLNFLGLNRHLGALMTSMTSDRRLIPPPVRS